MLQKAQVTHDKNPAVCKLGAFNSNNMNRQHLKSLFLLRVNLWHWLPLTVLYDAKKKSSSFQSY